MKRFTLLTLLILVFALTGAHASNSEVGRLKGVINAALEAVYGDCCADLSDQDKQSKVRSTLEKEYNLDVIIRRAIGRNWGLMNAKEQEQVLELIKQLVIKAYVKGMNGTTRPEIEMGESIMVTDKRMEIPSVIKTDDAKVNVLYRMGKMKSGWQIYDIVAEDISVVSNYRQQIDDHFRKGNAQELIDRLNELLTRDDIDEEIQL